MNEFRFYFLDFRFILFWAIKNHYGILMKGNISLLLIEIDEIDGFLLPNDVNLRMENVFMSQNKGLVRIF
jgi:hypothetical protein